VTVLIGNSTFEVNGPYGKPLPDDTAVGLAKLAASRLP